MEIKFSRHAKRRARLYGISETIITDRLNAMNLHQGKNEIFEDVSGFKYPLKIVVSVENDLATGVTTYPLNKGKDK